MLVADMESSSVYSELMAANGRQSMRMRRRSAGAGSFGGSGRWTVDSSKKVGRKKVDKSEEETREHVVLLLCKLGKLVLIFVFFQFCGNCCCVWLRHTPRGF